MRPGTWPVTPAAVRSDSFRIEYFDQEEAGGAAHRAAPPASGMRGVRG